MDAVDLFGLPSSSVHSQQTKSDRLRPPEPVDSLSYSERVDMERLERLYAGQVPTPEAAEMRFRHGGWAADRKRVQDALERCNAPRQRRERFNACGGGCVCEVRQGDGKGRLRAFYCGDRFCVPCGSSRARRVQANLRDLCSGKFARFLTLTLRGTDEPLAGTIDRLIRSFARLREHKFWRKAVKGGAYCVEIKRGQFQKLWHVHLHCLLIGSYISQHELSQAWSVASGGSFIVDIRAVGEDAKRIGYVAKYASKGFDRSVLAVPDDLDECLLALRGRRVLGTFGCWRSVDPEREPVEPGRWKVVGRFSRVWAQARGGEEWAVGFFRSMGVDVNVERVQREGERPSWQQGEEEEFDEHV